VTKRSSKKTQARRSSLKTFVKVVNYSHVMPTRYQMDVDLKAVVTPDVLDNSTKKVEARKEVRPPRHAHPGRAGARPKPGSGDAGLFLEAWHGRSGRLIAPAPQPLTPRLPRPPAPHPAPASRPQAKKLFQEKFQTGKNRWFFSKLRF
jgi:hypothetical protein